MAKQPELKIINDGWYENSDLNFNFRAIANAFENALWRTAADGESYPTNPNFMDVDLDVSDANLTNVRVLEVNSIEVANQAFPGFGSQYVYKFALLNCTPGAILTHNISGDPICFPPSTDGLVLKTRSDFLNWEADIDTDEDTVGITVQEDGVTVATNVTNIDFLWAPSVIATTPAGNQVDLELTDLLNFWKYGPFTGSASAPDTGGIIASASGLFATAAHVRRLVLPETTTDTNSDCWAVFEGHNYFLIGASPAPGTWGMATRFYGPDGSDDRSTVGTQIGGQLGHTAATAGGNTLTFFRKVNLAGVKYVDVAYSLLAVSPLFLDTTEICHRYVGIFDGPLAAAQGYATPSGVVFANSGTSQAATNSGNTACPVF